MLLGALGLGMNIMELNTTSAIQPQPPDEDPNVAQLRGYPEPFWDPKYECRAPKDHINTRISHSGSMDQYKGIPESMVGGSSCLCGLVGP